jgi:hypothetical protein
MDALMTPMAAAKGSIQLKDSRNWDTWFQLLEVMADSLGIWDEINPNKVLEVASTPASIATQQSDETPSVALIKTRNLAYVTSWIQSIVYLEVYKAAVRHMRPGSGPF